MSKARKKFTAAFIALGMLLLFAAVLQAPARADNEIGRVLVTTSSEPVALVPVSDISASTATEGCFIKSISWFDSAEKPVTAYFGPEDVRIEIEIGTEDGYIFAENMHVYLNDKESQFLRASDGRTVTVQRAFTPVLKEPVPIKHPGGETVTEGGWTSFVATAMYANDFQWSFISPEAEMFGIESTKGKFPGLTVDGNGSGKIVLHHIPLEMDGWQAACKFIGPGGAVLSEGAFIKVEPDPDKAAAAAALMPEEPGEAPKTPAAEGGEDSAEAGESGEHVHEFSTEWKWDEENHWLECECGERSIIEPHSFRWETVKEATRRKPGLERGVCTVCGYETERETEYMPGYRDNSGFKILRAVIIAVIVIAIGCAGFFGYQVWHSNRYSRKGRHMKK